jgi:hypothetical protein
VSLWLRFSSGFLSSNSWLWSGIVPPPRLSEWLPPCCCKWVTLSNTVEPSRRMETMLENDPSAVAEAVDEAGLNIVPFFHPVIYWPQSDKLQGAWGTESSGISHTKKRRASFWNELNLPDTPLEAWKLPRCARNNRIVRGSCRILWTHDVALLSI